uniref:Thiamin pyrophosphokinase thiamin-binding domain-containing protein n=1 Tax=Timema monikensis TaxID=170555 RepID=A0A7R9EBN3_9NEOP|nr:unnamed protein product [Timema monikensis]
MMNGVKEYKWNPVEFLNPKNTSLKYALLILNRPINYNHDLMISLWNRATVRVTVDGGTNNWFHFLNQEDALSKIYHHTPHIICGDMDSLEPKASQFFVGANVVETPDQDETDFTKALRVLDAYLKDDTAEEEDLPYELAKDMRGGSLVTCANLAQGFVLTYSNVLVDGVVALCDTSGRFDQIVANINTLYKAEGILGSLPVYQLAQDSLTWVLTPGIHAISVPDILRRHQCWCSLVPFGSRAKYVTTKGLKWDLDGQSMEFGKLLSTSNTYSDKPVVTVQTDTALTWSMGLGTVDD